MIDELRGQLKSGSAPALVEAAAVQLWTIRENQRRVLEEGSVVRDSRGSVIPHPSIAIIVTATKTLAAILKDHQRRGASPTTT